MGKASWLERVPRLRPWRNSDFGECASGKTPCGRGSRLDAELITNIRSRCSTWLNVQPAGNPVGKAASLDPDERETFPPNKFKNQIKFKIKKKDMGYIDETHKI